MGIGRRIQEARKLRRLSREQLAEMLEVTVSAVSNYENDISHPKEPILYKLIEVLGVDANFLFQDSVSHEKENPVVSYDGIPEEFRELIELYKAAPPEMQAAALAMLEAAEKVRLARDSSATDM